MSRRVLLVLLLAAVLTLAIGLRKLGLGEAAVVAVVMALAFGAESIRFVVKRFLAGYHK